MTLEDRIEDFRKSLEFWEGIEPYIQTGELNDALTSLACELNDILPLLEELQTLRKAYKLACEVVSCYSPETYKNADFYKSLYLLKAQETLEVEELWNSQKAREGNDS